MDRIAKHIDIEGLVQGVGFRPFIYRQARQHDLNGWVRNHTGGVEVYVEGVEYQCEKFIRTLKENAPPASKISQMKAKPAHLQNTHSFTIQPSLNGSQQITNISPDIAVCKDCLEDMKKQPRRFRYPFTNCTHCGPRFSIVKALPYDRRNTTTQDFEMCPECLKEYENVADRRFHAQPVSCRKCGPVYEWKIDEIVATKRRTDDNLYSKNPDCWQLAVGSAEKPEISDFLVFRDWQKVFRKKNGEFSTANSGKINPLLNQAAQFLTSGQILALKSIGGFQLIADARNEAAIRRLRKIKQRHSKPFAVMFKDLETAGEYTQISEEEAKVLQSWRRPIVILKDRKSLSKEVNRGFSTLGVVLPYSPLHYMMMEMLDTPAIVFTSANLKGQPLISKNQEARQLLEKDCCDAVLQHNRRIHHKLDDSIVRVIDDKPSLIRRARGYVPEPVLMKDSVEGILAMGADLKNTFCIGKDRRAILSQYIGDLEDFDVFHHYQNSIDDFNRLFRMNPEIIACDTHPSYHSSEWAKRMVQEHAHQGNDLKFIKVQHHHAHIASVMAEHHLDEKVIGVAMDGTGYGDDGKIWGSEFFINDLASYVRRYHLSYLSLPGGEKAIKEPWRLATAVLYRIFGKEFYQLPINFNQLVDRKDQALVVKVLKKNFNIHESCGMGRLFDVVAALLNLVHISYFDGEGPVKLENIITTSPESYPFQFGDDEIDYKPVIRSIVNDLIQEVPKGEIAARFHNTVVQMTEYGVEKLSASTGLKKVVLSGGIFQNKYITEQTTKRLNQNGFDVFMNEKVPSNDGGIALGQMAIAAKKLKNKPNYVLEHTGKD
jgi:hydrogenase maturation protein HypF